MSKQKTLNVCHHRNVFTDRAEVLDTPDFANLEINLLTLDSSLLLLNSEEPRILVAVFRHLTAFIRTSEEKLALVKEKGLFDFLLSKEIYIDNEKILVRRYALMTFKTILESLNVLRDLDPLITMKIVKLCVSFLINEKDNFCIEYMNAILSMCLDDPAVSNLLFHNLEYLEKLYGLIVKTTDPDIMLHSLESLFKMLNVKNPPAVQIYTADPLFPIDRIITELTNQFSEIRSINLRIIKMLIQDDSHLSPFSKSQRSTNVLQQLALIFCNEVMKENELEVIDVLATALQCPKLAQLYFEHNIFDKIVQDINNKPERFTSEKYCVILSIFTENAKFEKYLPRLYKAKIVSVYLECFLVQPPPPATHVITGLTRFMKLKDAANKIVEAYEQGLITILLNLMENPEVNIKTREQSAIFLATLLDFAFHPTATKLLEIKIAVLLANIIGQSMEDCSVDYFNLILALIETLAGFEDYRATLGEWSLLTKNMALLLKNSFGYKQLVANIFRCLCTIIEEANVREVLMQNFISASIKRGLKCSAHLVKSSVTNFIRQTCRFPELVNRYIERDILEILITNQKACSCISTWATAIEGILAKSPSLKFCIQNHLSFTDITVGNDFLVSKKKFDDFRIFQNILNNEVSPLEPFLIVNYERPHNPPMLEVNIPLEFFTPKELPAVTAEGGWTYCRTPGDPYLPLILDELNQELSHNGLTVNPTKVKRCIDFENLAKRVRIVAVLVVGAMSKNLNKVHLKSDEECAKKYVREHLKNLAKILHTSFIPLGMIETGCQFERAVFFKTLADQIGLPCTLQRSVDSRILFNEVPLPLEQEFDVHCERDRVYIPWRKLRPTHIVDLMFNVGELYPIHSREAYHYLRLPQ